jgi:hypothetical protein
MTIAFNKDVVINILNYKHKSSGDLEQVKFIGGNNYELIMYYNEGNYYCKTNFKVINGEFVVKYGIHGLVEFYPVKKVKKVVEYFE